MKRFLFVALLFALFSCAGGDDEGQDFGNLLDSPEGLIVTQEEHPDGWGRSECFACHPINEIHTVDRTGGLFPVEDIQELVEQQGLDSCPLCHGDNGVLE